MARPTLRELVSRVLDLRMALAGALFMGGLVFVVNLSHGAGPALVAATKQGTYTFFFAGLVMRWCQRLAQTIDGRALAVALATVLPSVLAVSLTFGVHSLRGTPDPVASTLPTLFLGPPSFFGWAWRMSGQRAASDQYQPSKGEPSPSSRSVADPSGSKR